MATAVISDLHLGTQSGSDLLRRPEFRELLFERLAGAERIVLLGDVVELREWPLDDVLETAAPFFQDLRAAFPETEIVVVPGNHDYQLDPWPESRRLDPEAPPLELETLIEPDPDGPLGRLLPDDERLTVAYPGIWLSEDVYATHGHYADCHSTTPTLENIGAAAMQRSLGELPDDRRVPDDYEAALAPLYALAFSLAQGKRHGHPGSRASVELWNRLASSTPRALLFGGVVLPSVLFAVNRLGLGPFSANLSGTQLAKSATASMIDVVTLLEIDAAWVVHGHSHRAGPIESDVAADWQAGRAGLVNTGCWIYERGPFGSPTPDSGWFPGVIAWVEEAGPPRIERVLAGGPLEVPPRG